MDPEINSSGTDTLISTTFPYDRTSAQADWEIRALAVAVLKLLDREAPLLLGDFTIERHLDGTETATPAYSKVWRAALPRRDAMPD